MGVILSVTVALRWPRIDPDIVEVTHSEVRSDHFVVEYRMSRPFSVKLKHGIRKSRPPATGLWSPSKSEVVALIDSSRTLLRGEHAIRLRVDRGRALEIKYDGKEVEVHPWLEETAESVNWNPPGDSVGYGNGVGDDLIHFHVSSEQTEYLMIYMGTDLRNP